MVAPTHPLKINGQAWDRAKVVSYLCDQTACSSKSLGSILKAGWIDPAEADFPGAKVWPLPGFSALYEWLEADPELAKQYARAKELQAEYMEGELNEIADDGRNDYMERVNQDGEVVGYQVNGEHISRSKLRIETRKWLMGKLRPKKYGDKVELVGDPERPVQHKVDVTVKPDDAYLAMLKGNGNS